MLITSTRLHNTPIMSLHIGGRVGTTKRAVIDPSNLRIIAHEVSTASPGPRYLLSSSIREFGPLGIIIDTSDEFVELGDVVKLDELLDLKFSPIAMQVRDEDGKKLGKVTDFTLDSVSFEIQQLSVRKSVFTGIADASGLLIHRSQIIEINNAAIIVRSSKQKVATPAIETTRGAFINPFRTTPQSPQVESASATSP